MRLPRSLALLPALALLLAACSALQGQPPAPTPQDFGGIAAALDAQGIRVDNPVAGDAGCTDTAMIQSAIGFDVSGAGVATPIHARLYKFNDNDAYQRRRAEVDECAGAWASDPPDVEFIDASPFVIVLQGPIPDAFKAALTAGLKSAAGD
jgi:hypothetical protein